MSFEKNVFETDLRLVLGHACYLVLYNIYSIYFLQLNPTFILLFATRLL